jgi:hypothetical protein
VAQGIHYLDKTEPLMSAAQGTVTLATTDKLIIPAAFTNAWSAGFGGKVGKTIYLTYYGSITTAATPTNIGVELYWGGADAGGTLLASSAALGDPVGDLQVRDGGDRVAERPFHCPRRCADGRER